MIMLSLFFLFPLLINICTSKICNVLDWGAVGDGINDDTLAIQRAMDACTSTESEEAIILFPSSYIFYTYPIRLNKNNLHLWIDNNSTIFASPDWNTTDNGSMMHQPEDTLTSYKMELQKI